LLTLPCYVLIVSCFIDNSNLLKINDITKAFALKFSMKALFFEG